MIGGRLKFKNAKPT